MPEQALAGLPRPQRHALDVALLRAEPGPEPPDQRAVAVALLGVIRALADTAPVIVGVDDLPWLDRASAAVLEYALRRLTGQRAGLLATIAPDAPSPATPLRQWFSPERMQSLLVGPLRLEDLDALLRAKGGPPDSWPEVVAVYEASGGNPFFAGTGSRAGCRRPPAKRRAAASGTRVAQAARPAPAAVAVRRWPRRGAARGGGRESRRQRGPGRVR